VVVLRALLQKGRVRSGCHTPRGDSTMSVPFFRRGVPPPPAGAPAGEAPVAGSMYGTSIQPIEGWVLQDNHEERARPRDPDFQLSIVEQEQPLPSIYRPRGDEKLGDREVRLSVLHNMHPDEEEEYHSHLVTKLKTLFGEHFDVEAGLVSNATPMGRLTGKAFSAALPARSTTRGDAGARGLDLAEVVRQLVPGALSARDPALERVQLGHGEDVALRGASLRYHITGIDMQGGVLTGLRLSAWEW
jgi:hypothetical protein